MPYKTADLYSCLLHTRPHTTHTESSRHQGSDVQDDNGAFDDDTNDHVYGSESSTALSLVHNDAYQSTSTTTHRSAIFTYSSCHFVIKKDKHNNQLQLVRHGNLKRSWGEVLSDTTKRL